MARTRTCAEMRDDAYKRADEETNTDRFPTAEVDRYVNQGIAELYDLLIDARGREYYETTPADTTTTSAQSYALPATFYKLINARILNGSNQSWTLQPFMNAEESAIEDLAATTNNGPYWYQIRSGNLYIAPTPTAGLTLRMSSLAPPRLTASTDGKSTWCSLRPSASRQRIVFGTLYSRSTMTWL
jgi:hypothetical protein